ncbi:Polynucleotidyl transferase- ribonuclease H-like superfamily protein, partial [Striga hermonthica]
RTLANLPLLAKPIHGEELVLYISVGESAVSSVLLREEGVAQFPIYYVSRVMQGAELRYSEIEKCALAVVVTVRKLRPYFLNHKVKVRTNMPLEQTLGQPAVSGRLVKWAVELSEYSIKYEPRKAIKGHVLADFIQEGTKEEEDGGGMWQLFADGSVSRSGAGLGIVLISPKGDYLVFVVKMGFRVSNNEAEYEAVTKGLQLALAGGARRIQVHSDSQLVVGQFQEGFEIKEDRLQRHVDNIKKLKEEFGTFELIQIPRGENVRADLLSKIAQSLDDCKSRSVTLLHMERSATEVEVAEIEEVEDWRAPILKELREGTTKVILRAGYFWPTMKADAKEMARRCMKCQKHDPLIHQPAETMTTMSAPIPFAQWGIDLVGPMPQATGQRKFLIVAVDYFTKWVEAEPLAKITEEKVVQFLYNNICCRFGVPKILISDNGTQFNGKRIRVWCEEMGIEQHFASVAHPQANGQVEVTNRIILNGLKTRLEKASGAWVDELTSVLWAYRTTPRSTTGETPFSLVYGMEALLPVELELQSQQSSTYDQEQNEELMLTALDTIEELREQASTRVEAYKQRMRAAHDRKVKIRRFQVGDLVWKRVDVLKHVGKLEPNWEGPYLVKKVHAGGAYSLKDFIRNRCLGNPLEGFLVQLIEPLYTYIFQLSSPAHRRRPPPSTTAGNRPAPSEVVRAQPHATARITRSRTLPRPDASPSSDAHKHRTKAR